MRLTNTFLAIMIGLGSLTGQAPQKPTSSEIFDAIQKLQVLGSVLYVAAHPDDENTQLISYFANSQKYSTTYLSLTRGDGGQNLIGTEIGEQLGVIRTQELLRARGTDGGHQMFSRAIDFGYSKNPDETLNVWNKEEILSDVIWAIRKNRPDIIIHRFDHRTPGSTHGHHTASAMLSYEAFPMVGEASVRPEQLKYVSTWSPTRQFFNTSWFFYGSREKFEEADKSDMVSVDVGEYYPTLGKSNNEIAAASRSFHKSQGFGATGSRGSNMEYLELVQGEDISPGDDPFKGINTKWTRVKGGKEVGEMLRKIETDFDLTDPSASIPALVEVYRTLSGMEDDGFWIPKKKEELKQILLWCGGVYVEAVAEDYSAAPGQIIDVEIEAINRSDAHIDLEKLSINPGDLDTTVNLFLENNESYHFDFHYKLPDGLPYSTTYWLREPGSPGLYHVENQEMIGKPEGDRPSYLEFSLSIEGEKFQYRTPLVYKRNDPVDGEVYRPFEVSPPVFLNFTDEVLVFGQQTAKDIQVIVKAGTEKLRGTVSLNAPDGWNVSPSGVSVSLAEKNQEQLINFSVVPPSYASTNEIEAVFRDEENEGTNSESVTLIDYDHFPLQTIVRPAKVKVVRVDLRRDGDHIGYIMGAGDKIPEFLQQVGYHVSLLEEGDLKADNLSQFDAVIVGIRAYNTDERLRFHQDELFKYVENGGTMIVQYNTNRGLTIENIAPYPLELSRDRVTVEESEVRLIAPEHPVVKGPNKITAADFEGWVQERGLYFPDKWDEKFTPILSSNDPDEPPRDGGLLIAPYGDGWYIYTGYSWFRELPAGVPGAYRIFTNLISLGKQSEP